MVADNQYWVGLNPKLKNVPSLAQLEEDLTDDKGRVNRCSRPIFLRCLTN